MKIQRPIKCFKEGDVVRVKLPKAVHSGCSKFSNRKVIRKVFKNVVLLDDGQSWSTDRIVRDNSVSATTTPGILMNNTMTNNSAPQLRKSSRNTQSKPLWHNDYDMQ